VRRVGGVFGRADDLPPAELLANGTSFHVVDGTPEEVLALAREAAGGKDVRIGGGPTTVREFLSVGLVDVMQVVLVPSIVLGRGVSLWEGLEGLEDGDDVESIPSATTGVMHLIFRRKA
jgi:dihydrofolate reductase